VDQLVAYLEYPSPFNLFFVAGQAKTVLSFFAFPFLENLHRYDEDTLVTVEMTLETIVGCTHGYKCDNTLNSL